MSRRLTDLPTPWLALLLVATLAAGCAPTYRYEPMVRKPVPTLSDPQQQRPVEKGTIVVRGGDTLYALARQNGTSVRALIDANRLSPPFTIRPGQRLKLPRARFHLVEDGETVYSLALRYDVDMGSLVRINQIPPPFRIERGQRLRLPEARGTAPSEPAGPTMVALAPPETATDGTASLPPVSAPKPPVVPTALPPGDTSAALSPGWIRPDPEPLKSPPPRSGQRFLWPVRGKVIVAFGARKGGLHNDGINIAARTGDAVRATENGVVAYAGNQLQGFGNLILIRHGGGWMSAYAHVSILMVKRGDVVQRGQVIAQVGRTGNVSEPQLHFELRRGDRAVDPRNYLVRLASAEQQKRLTSAVFPGDLPDPG